MPNPKFHVFLSHNSADKPAVEELARRLQAEHVEPWLDKWRLVPGDPWQPAIEDVLAECGSCAVCIGAGGIGTWQDEEMRAAINRRVTAGRAADPRDRFRVIPVLLPGVARPERSLLPAFLVSTTWVEFRATLDEPEPFRRLLCGIRGVEPGDAPGETILEGECPYRGLEFFDEAHARFFFGREALTEWLLTALRRTPAGAESRFLAVLGPSGSGKSSLARAGLVPALRAGGLDGSDAWPVVVTQPGAEPLESLAVAMTKAGGGEPTAGAVHGLMADLRASDNALHLTARLALRDAPPARRLVLLVDHFEEVFTLCSDDAARKAFIDNLMRAASASGGQTVVVLAMRADFLGRCATHPTLAAALSDHQALVGPMTEDELRRAIERPARRVGCEVEPGLVDVLIQDVQGQSGALPLMQYALLELWERRDGRRLTLEAYRAVGGLRGALERRANEVFSQFSEGERELCRRIFLRLTQPGEGTEDTKRRATMRELASVGSGEEAVRSMLARLADARLITAEGDDRRPGEGAVDVAHEALIRGWSQLRKWIDADRAGLRTQRRLTEAAREWEANGRDASFLYGGARLATAKEWSGTHGAELNVLEAEFLSASVDAEGKRKSDETARAKARLALERWRLRLALALAATLLLTVAGVAAAALWYQHDHFLRTTERTKRAADTERGVATALDEAATLGKQAATLTDDPARWEAALAEALSAVKRAEDVLYNGEGTDELRTKVARMRQELEAADKDRRMMARIEEARLQSAVVGKDGVFDYAGGAALYAEAFEKDMRLGALGVNQAAARINQRAVREGLLAALDDWSAITPNKRDRTRLREIIQAADPDPGSYRNRSQALLDRKDWDGLRQLTFGSGAATPPGANLEWLGRRLRHADASEAVQFLKDANDRRPGDFWVVFELAYACRQTKPPATDEAIRYYTAARALRPGSAGARCNLGTALCARGRLDEAAAEYRKALELKPDYVSARNGLGDALDRMGRPEEAIAEYDRVLTFFKPDDPNTHSNRGDVLHEMGRIDAAMKEHQKALDLDPNNPSAHNGLAWDLRDKGLLKEAEAQCHTALAIQPDFATAHNTLGCVLHDENRLDDAIAEHQRAIELAPAYGLAYNNLGWDFRDKGRLDDAMREYRKAIELQPRLALAHDNLGYALYLKKRMGEAGDEYRRAVDCKPDYAEAWFGLGFALREQGRFAESLDAFRRCHELGEKQSGWSHPSARWVRQAERLVRRAAMLPAILSGEAAPASSAAGLRFAQLCQYKHQYGEAVKFYAQSFVAEPASANDLNAGRRYNAAGAAALAAAGKGEDAAAGDDKRAAGWRRQAFDWLRADLAAWTKQIDGGKPEDRAAAAKTLQLWQEDSDLAGVRDKDALVKLPPDEQDAWRRLWADVDALLEKAGPK